MQSRGGGHAAVGTRGISSGQKFPAKTPEVSLQATVSFQSDGPLQGADAQDDPFCVRQNAYINVSFTGNSSYGLILTSSYGLHPYLLLWSHPYLSSYGLILTSYGLILTSSYGLILTSSYGLILTSSYGLILTSLLSHPWFLDHFQDC